MEAECEMARWYGTGGKCVARVCLQLLRSRLFLSLGNVPSM